MSDNLRCLPSDAKPAAGWSYPALVKRFRRRPGNALECDHGPDLVSRSDVD